ncbi:hypothetical protein K2Y00_00200 [Patescibacteria group bacterium]|nr:hypothetical protein [Patescibacteria group bacterium]
MSEGPHTKLTEVGKMLLPEHPVGQIPLGEIAEADEKALSAMIASRGLAFDELLTDECRNHPEAAGKNRWPLEDRLRLAVMYVDGRSMDEIAQVLTATRKARGVDRAVRSGTVKVQVGEWMTDYAGDIGESARSYRRWHAIMAPEESGIEEELKVLETEVFHLPRHLIFHTVEETLDTSSRQLPAAGKVKGNVQMTHIKIAVRLLYMKFKLHASSQELVAEAYSMSGTPTDEETVNKFTLRLLTKQAKAAVGIKQGRPPAKK